MDSDNDEETYYMEDGFNKPITEEILNDMKKFKKIKFSMQFNQPFDFTSLENIESIFIGLFFNQSLDYLPPNLKELSFCFVSKFNNSIDNLPNSVEYICFGNDFNQNIDNLPLRLKELHLSSNFNKPIDFLPHGLEKLSMWCRNYSHNILNLPQTLKKLEIFNSILIRIDVIIPKNCEIIKIN